MKTQKDLMKILEQINRKGYPAYKQTLGMYDFEKYCLSIERVQGDPFASPSKIKITIDSGIAKFPKKLYDTSYKKIALQDYLLRRFGKELAAFNNKAKGSGKSGLMYISKCGQEIIERNACQIDRKTGEIAIKMEIGFPAYGRTIQAYELITILFDYLPKIVNNSLMYENTEKKVLQSIIELSEDQFYIRTHLKQLGLIAFIANDSVLPRESGVSKKPLKNAIRFVSPKQMEISLQLPNKGVIKGMGIKEGITLIVGGGYHGKSTLLKAIELGVYNHIFGDGREYVITDDTAMKVRAEDGRSIKNVDISLFINNLPNKNNTHNFNSENASGSTSQAANVIEALEMQSKVLLIDEDTSATNFMIRDELMERVVTKDKEPITPFINRVKMLYDKYGVSTIMVAGSCGAYFEKSTQVIQMDNYRPMEITQLVKKETELYNIEHKILNKREICGNDEKISLCRYIETKKEMMTQKVKIKTHGLDMIMIDKEAIDVRYIEQLVDNEQLEFIGKVLSELVKTSRKKIKISNLVDDIYCEIQDMGMSKWGEKYNFTYRSAVARKQEVCACINRYRKLDIINEC